jgi:hypothetical protein
MANVDAANQVAAPRARLSRKVCYGKSTIAASRQRREVQKNRLTLSSLWLITYPRFWFRHGYLNLSGRNATRFRIWILSPQDLDLT